VEYKNIIYSFIDSALFSFNYENLIQSASVSWSSFSNQTAPVSGLVDYGLSVTSSGKLVLYGGSKEKGAVKLQRQRVFDNFNDLWIVDLTLKSPSFLSVQWDIEGSGGYSRIISLEGEVLCILNANFQNAVIVLDIGLMQSFPLSISNLPGNLKRTAFSIAPLNSTDYIWWLQSI
jgi:hypothetical protein